MGSTCALTCDRGFSVDFGQGGGEIVCGPDGTWSEPSPCIANVCEPTAVLNSDYAGADSVVGATGDAVSVTCDNGYTALTSGAHGDAVATLQCQPDGLFTTMECVPQICD